MWSKSIQLCLAAANLLLLSPEKVVIMAWPSGENRDEVPRHWREYWLGAEGCMVGWWDEMDMGHLPNLGKQIWDHAWLCQCICRLSTSIGPRFTAAEPSRVAPQCLQGLKLEKYCVFSASKGGGEKVLPNLARFTPYTCHHITSCMWSWLISLRWAQDILCYIVMVVRGYKES